MLSNSDSDFIKNLYKSFSIYHEYPMTWEKQIVLRVSLLHLVLRFKLPRSIR